MALSDADDELAEAWLKGRALRRALRAACGAALPWGEDDPEG